VSSVPFLPYLGEAQEKCLFDSPVLSIPQPGMRGPIDKRSMQEAPSGAALPGDEPPLPMLHADFPPFGPKSVHFSAKLPNYSVEGCFYDISLRLIE